MKSLTTFYRYMAEQLAMWCDTSADADIKTVCARFNTEGISFFGIRLPEYGKDLEKGLDRGFVSLQSFQGFAKKGALPILFGGFLDLVFDRENGLLLENPSIDAIFALRQLTLSMSKIELPVERDKIDAALQKYIQCEHDVRSFDVRFNANYKDVFVAMSKRLWTGLFTAVDLAIYNGEVIPKHGPGSTADKLRGNAKWNQQYWTERLEEIFPSGEYLIPNWRFLPDLVHCDIVEPGAEIPVKVITVPKTLKSPRIIAMEPTCMQYMQQGILRLIVDGVRADDIARSFIDFSDQTPNQRMARTGSRDGTLATLDLSEASDRVSNQHVRTMLSRHPWLLAGVDATRSRKADVPGHGVIRLAKFASMGSALCFPFEAMVFTTVVFLGIQDALNRPLTMKDIQSLKGRVRVYGDDIVVPAEYVESVACALEAFGFKVNASKSFWNGKFRESCGKEYYDGHDVSIVKVRSLFPEQRKYAQEIISTVSLRNQLFLRGFPEDGKLIQFLDQIILDLGLPYPQIRSLDTPIIGRLSTEYKVEKMHKHLQIPLVRGMVVDARIPSDSLDGYGALMKCLTKSGDLPFLDERHLERAGRPVRVRIKEQYGSVG